MLRPTHFVLLSAVILCAYAAPAAQQPVPVPLKEATPSKEVSGPSAPRTGGDVLPERRPDAAGHGSADGDLDTDATSHWGYTTYYGPAWNYGGWAGRGYGWNHGWRTNYWY